LRTIKTHSALLIPTLAFAVAIGLFVLPGWKQRQGPSGSGYLPLSSVAQASEINSWTLAINKVKEDRGEPMGRQAKVEIPGQVRHYSDTRRFLAIQVAEVREQKLSTPQDLVELAQMIKGGEMVALRPATPDYVLIGVGGLAGKDAFTRYIDGKSVGLFNERALKAEYSRLAELQTKHEKEIATLTKELGGLGKRERSKKANLQSKIASSQKSIKSVREEKALLDRYYGDADRRAEFFSEYQSLVDVAGSFPERDFNIDDGAGRRDLKVRLLSSLRPEALKVMEEIAHSYREKFGRPLPITSLVRPDEYQHQLSKTNPNATRIQTPPHSTGLAFDIYYRFMTAEEQAHVMSHLAQLKDAARIEVLRENRDHYHVFAFADGQRPNESLISASLGSTRTVKAAKAHHAQPAAAKAKKSPAKKTSRKSPRSRKRR
jgi:hypothetical protein